MPVIVAGPILPQRLIESIEISGDRRLDALLRGRQVC
jgi:hypothetical protein